MPLPAHEIWPDLWQSASAWRGRMIEEFARAEAAVTEALIQLSNVPTKGKNINLPHLVGQRFAALAEAIGTDGPFAVEGKALSKALEEFIAFETLRATLCHGTQTITVDHKGRWHVTLRLQALRNGKVVRETLVLDENEAIERCKMIHAARQRLESKISLMIKALAG
nr:hypothetical protein BV87_00410 [Sphingobium yanoikuyae]